MLYWIQIWPGSGISCTNHILPFPEKGELVHCLLRQMWVHKVTMWATIFTGTGRNLLKKKELKRRIERLRCQLEDMVKKDEASREEILSMSRKLDRLIFKYQRLEK